MTLDDIVTMLLAEAIDRQRACRSIDAPWALISLLGKDARTRAVRAGWVYR